MESQDPCYFLASKMLIERGFKLEPIPSDAAGFSVDKLEARLKALKRQLQEEAEGKQFAGFIYLVRFLGYWSAVLNSVRYPRITIHSATPYLWRGEENSSSLRMNTIFWLYAMMFTSA